MANQGDVSYKELDRPYNNLLERENFVSSSPAETPKANAATSSAAASAGTSGASSNGSVESVPVRTDGSMGDVWIKNFIRSENWKPKKAGFYLDGRTGKAEFTGVYISGAVQALSGRIGGFNIGSTELSVTTSGNKTSISSGSVAFAAGPALAPTVQILREGKIYVGASSPIVIDGVSKEIESNNYVSGAFGRGFHLDSNLLEVGNIACRGIFRTAVFQKDIINVIAGSFVVSPNGDVLDEDMTANDTATMTIKGTVTFALNDILRIKEVNGDNVDDEWLRVTSIDNAPTYSLQRDLSGNYLSNNNPTWRKGAAVVDYGQSGQGGVYMTASDNNAPYLSVFEHSGSPWTEIDTKLRLGNLNGFLGYDSDLYGIGIGDETTFMKYDSTNGLQIQGSILITNPGDLNISSLTNDAGFTNDDSLNDFIEGAYVDDKEALQDQIDGLTLSWFYEGEPTLENIPASDWTTDSLKNEHLGDLYYDLTTGDAYRFVLDGTYQWYNIPDAAVSEALAAAAAAQDTADGKRRVFTTTPFTPYDVGDLWLTSLSAVSGDLKKCVAAKASGSYDAAHWVNATKYTDNAMAEQAISDAAVAQAAAEDAQITAWAKIQTYYQASMPLPEYTNVPDNESYNKYVGDLWYDTDDSSTWRYSKTANGSNFDYTFLAQDVPESVFDAIDGKRTVFMTTPTTPYYVGDLWLTSSSASTGDLKKCITENLTGAYSASHWVVATKYTDDTVALTAISDAADAQTLAITAQTTADTKIQTYYQATMPLTEYLNVPNNTEYNKLVGDMWYDTAATETWRYSKVANGGNFDYKFMEQTIPASVFDTIDGKGTIFTTEPAPPYYLGDLWLTSLAATSGDLKKCVVERLTGSYNAADWLVAAKYTDDTTANVQKGRLDDIADDAKITPVDKLAAKAIWDAIVTEGTPTTGTITAHAISLSVLTTNFDSKFSALNVYLNTTLEVFSDMGATTDIVRSEWDTAWNNYYNAKNLLNNAIADKVATLADWDGVTGDGKPEDNATVGADWGVNLGNIPARFEAPSGTGLFLSATNMGYYAGGNWKTYIDNQGNFILGDIASNETGLAWSQSTGELTIKGNITATDGTFHGNLDAATGTLGAITIGVNAWHVDANGNMWWGTFSTYADASIKISAAGVANLSGLVVGTNVGIGTAVTSSEVTTIIGNTVTTGYVNALGITAGSINASNITAGTMTGSIVQTAAAGYRVRLNGPWNTIDMMAWDSVVGQIYCSAANDVVISAADDVVFAAGGAIRCGAHSNSFKPLSDQSYDLGQEGQRWRTVYAHTYSARGDNGETDSFEMVTNIDQRKITVSGKSVVEKIYLQKRTVYIIGGIVTTVGSRGGWVEAE